MRKVRLGLVVLGVLLVLSLALGDGGTINTALRCASPSLSHPFGCDGLGRDLLTLSLKGFYVSLSISLSSAFLGVLVGTLMAMAASGRGFPAAVARGISDGMKVLPPVILTLLFVALWGGGIGIVIAAIAISSSASVARTLSGVLSTLRSEDHIQAAYALGLKKRRIWHRHILPSLFPYIREHFASITLSAILTESSLSYLGIGVDPTTPTLGSILSSGKALVLSHPHVVVFPSLFLLILSFSLLLVSRGLSEVDSSLQ